MIEIPTCELVGIFADVIGFASKDKDLASINAVRLRWDGEHMHAEATDRHVFGHAHWEPGDDPEIDAQEELGTKWGGVDDPWSIIIPLDEAKKVISVFKLPVKKGWTKLIVDVLDGEKLTISRERTDVRPALKHVITTIEADVPFPDSRRMFSDTLFDVGTPRIAFNAKLLALFAKVRQRGELIMSFSGEDSVVRVTIGGRFDGAITPIRLSPTPPPKPRPVVEDDYDGPDLLGEIDDPADEVTAKKNGRHLVSVGAGTSEDVDF